MGKSGFNLKKLTSGNFQALTHPFSIFCIGDSALTIDLGNSIGESLNRKVLAMQSWLQQHPFEGMVDIVPAYSSLTVLYDPATVRRKYQPAGTVSGWVGQQLETAFHSSGDALSGSGALVEIPVCYDPETGMDLVAMARHKKLSVEEVIHLHTSVSYRVYMIGFLPGFPYLAEVAPVLATPRKARPVSVLPGSVGIAGSQTGIYPQASPGGWHIIGRTPVKLFDPAAQGIVRLKAGDTVRFYAIGLAEFKEREMWGVW